MFRRTALQVRSLPTSLVAILLCSFLIQGFYVLSSRAYLLARLIADDAFYYFKIALRYQESGRFTFDGIHATNGFHPLHQYWVTALTYLTTDPLLLIRATLLSGISFHLIGTLLLYAIARRFLTVNGALLAAMIWALSPALVRINLLGLENGLLGLVLLASLWWFLRVRDQGTSIRRRDMVVLGALLGLGFLARIDEVFWIAIVSICLFKSVAAGGWRRAVRLWRALLVPLTLIVAPFFFHNWDTFHRLFPISGAVKRFQAESWIHATYGTPFDLSFLSFTFKTAVLQVIQWGGYLTSAFWALPLHVLTGFQELDERLVAQHQSTLIVAFAVAALLLAFLLARRIPLWTYVRTVRSSLRDHAALVPLKPFFAFTLLHLAAYLLFFPTQIGYADKWYFIPEYLSALFIGAWAAERILLSSPRALRVVMCGGTALATAFFIITFASRSHSPLLATYASDTITATKIPAAEWVNAHIPAGARIGSWNAGLVGYLIDRPVIHLEGLVNDYEHFEEFLRKGRTTDYILRENIQYLADYEGARDQPITTFYGISTDRLEQLYTRGGGGTTFYVFRVRRETL